MMNKLTEEEKFLLLGKLTGTLGPEEEIALKELLKDNPDAQMAYEELESSIPVEDPSAYFAHRQGAPAWRDLTQEFRERPSRHEIKKIPFYRRSWVAAAVLSGLLIGGTLFTWNLFRKTVLPVVSQAKNPGIELTLPNGKVINLSSRQGVINAGTAQLNNTSKSLTYSLNNTHTAGTNTLTVPIGMDYKINLEDGSEVWLNAATKLGFPFAFTGKTREIRINGEAYIKVAKDAARPFIVHLPKSDVLVMGTEFNINTYDEDAEKVALVEGAVNLKVPGGESRLLPGNQSIYTAGSPVKQETFDPKYVLSWQKGLYYFNDATLLEISKVIPRWYGIKLMIDDPEINNRRFSGVINRNRPISLFLDDLKMIARIDAWFDKDSTLHLKQ